MCTNACRIFRAQTIAQWGGCRPPHPPRDGVIKLMYCQGGGNACHDKALGGFYCGTSTPQWPSCTVTLPNPLPPAPYRTPPHRPHARPVPHPPNPNLATHVPRPGDFLQTLQTYKKLRLPCFDNLTAMPQGPDEAALDAEAELSAELRGPEPMLLNSSSLLCS